MHLISRLRDDAALRYLCKESPTGKWGRPCKYTSKVIINDIDQNYFRLIPGDEEQTVYAAQVYPKSFKRNIMLVCWSMSHTSKPPEKISINFTSVLMWIWNQRMYYSITTAGSRSSSSIAMGNSTPA